MSRRGTTTALLGLALLLAPAGSQHAEVATDVYDPSYIILLGITEGPDPIPHVSWDPVLQRENLQGGVLNPGGFQRGDGPPDVAVLPGAHTPLAVWAFDTGNDKQIAFAEWAPGGWPEQPVFISVSAEDALDPRLFASDAGEIYVVWWEQGLSERVLWAVRDAEEGDWSAPMPLTDDGRRPSLARIEPDKILIAFERDAGDGSQLVIVATIKPNLATTYVTVAEVNHGSPLDVQLHHRGGRTWMEWKHGDNMFAYSELIAGQWRAPKTKPWLDRSWLGQANVRREILNEIAGN